MRFAAILALAAAFVMHHAAPARAWGWDGHRIVCALAWDELTPPMRARIEAILEKPGRDAFAESCLWADDVIRWRRETASWHYLNVPKGATRIDMARDCAAPNSCVAEQIGLHAARLGRPWALDDLRFTAHFIGDIHQPLHISYAEDRGGNEIKGKFDGVDANMHGVWDYNMLDSTHKAWPEIAADLHGRITPADRAAWQSGTPADWANESLAITLSAPVGYHPYDPPFVFGEDYTKANLPTVYRQMEKAGVRLAWVLTQAWK
ncbi:MAG: S1/P1 nuclease [Rhodospirillaceae bacterium]|nr:S1/P1 nuclease [Rhodospirillaceae bacterium]